MSTESSRDGGLAAVDAPCLDRDREELVGVVAHHAVAADAVAERVGRVRDEAARAAEADRLGLPVALARLADGQLQLDDLVLVLRQPEAGGQGRREEPGLEEHQLDAVLGAVLVPAAADEEVPADGAARLGPEVAGELEVRLGRDHVVAHGRRGPEEVHRDRVGLRAGTAARSSGSRCSYVLLVAGRVIDGMLAEVLQERPASGGRTPPGCWSRCRAPRSRPPGSPTGRARTATAHPRRCAACRRRGPSRGPAVSVGSLTRTPRFRCWFRTRAWQTR